MLCLQLLLLQFPVMLHHQSLPAACTLGFVETADVLLVLLQRLLLAANSCFQLGCSQLADHSSSLVSSQVLDLQACKHHKYSGIISKFRTVHKTTIKAHTVVTVRLTLPAMPVIIRVLLLGRQC